LTRDPGKRLIHFFEYYRNGYRSFYSLALDGLAAAFAPPHSVIHLPELNSNWPERNHGKKIT
jgi:hypothetical protein